MKKTPIYQNATGPVAIRMTNDYLFKALMQKNKKVLKALICSLLHLEPVTIRKAEITNPIILGESISEKDIILDVNVKLSVGKQVNLEMQVVNHLNWPERSTYYACRNFASLNSGEDYQDVAPLHHIGILDFTPLEAFPGFYSTYKLSEIHDHHLYTDKFSISVLDLTHIDLATEEDKSYNIDIWASLFRAQTWEDIKMLAEKYESIDEAATTIYQLSSDEKIRLQCEAREKYERDQRSVQHMLEKLQKENAEQKKALAESQKEIEKLKRNIADLQSEQAKNK